MGLDIELEIKYHDGEWTNYILATDYVKQTLNANPAKGFCDSPNYRYNGGDFEICPEENICAGQEIIRDLWSADNWHEYTAMLEEEAYANVYGYYEHLDLLMLMLDKWSFNEVLKAIDVYGKNNFRVNFNW